MENLIGFILPPLIDVINTRFTNTNIKFLISIIICSIISFLVNPTLVDQIKLGTLQEVFKTIGIVWTQSQIAYKLYWEKSAVRKNYF